MRNQRFSSSFLIFIAVAILQISGCGFLNRSSSSNDDDPKAGEDSDITWKSVTGESTSDSEAEFSGILNGLDVESCIITIDKDKEEPYDFTETIELIEYKFTATETGEYAARFICEDENATSSPDSEWTDLISLEIAAEAEVSLAPVAKDDVFKASYYGTTTFNVISNDSDPDGGTLSLDSFATPSHGSLTKQSNSLVYQPDTDYIGEDSFTYVVSNGSKTHEATAKIWVYDGLDFNGRIYQVSNKVKSVVVNDLDGDGILDVVVALNADKKVGVYMSDGLSTMFKNSFTETLYSTTSNCAVEHVYMADFNEDKIKDIVYLGNSGFKGIGILAGSADGSFAADVQYSIPNTTYMGIFADFNDDNYIDVVIPSYQNVSVYVGNTSSNIGFASEVSYDKSSYNLVDYLYGGAVGDFDEDGNLDLVIATTDDDSIGIMTGNGDGTFNSATRISSLSNQGYSFVVEDFNSDGLDDIAVAGGLSENGAVDVLLANANGSIGFATKITYAVDEKVKKLMARDINGDGEYDLIVSHVNNHISRLSVFTGIGDGTFNTRVDYHYPDTGKEFDLGDINNDGAIDVIAGTEQDSTFSIIYGGVTSGKGNGTMGGILYDGGPTEQSIISADFNNDSILDLVTTSWFDSAAGNSAHILLGNGSGGEGDGTFGSALQLSYVDNSMPTKVHSADFNEDGDLDIAILNYSDATAGRSFGILLGNGDGTFATKVNYFTGETNAPDDLEIGDFDEDGILDIAITTGLSDKLLIFLGNGSAGTGDGTFVSGSPSYSYAVGNDCKALTSGDFDLDGNLDLAMINRIDGNMSVSFGAGDGTFNNNGGIVNYSGSDNNQLDIVAADVNEDGYPDLIATGGNARTVDVYMNDGDGTFATKVAYAVPTNQYAKDIEIVDINSDDILDIVITGTEVGVFLGQGTAGVGNGTFKTLIQFVGGRNLTVGDFNGDGKPDIASTIEGLDKIQILLNSKY